MATTPSFVKITALPPVPKGFTGDPEIWRFMEALRQRVGGDTGDLIYNAAYDSSQAAASLEPLVYAVAQEVQTSLEGQIRAIIEEAQTERIDTASTDNNVTPLPNPEGFSFDDIPVAALIQQAIDSAPVQSIFGRKGDVVATEGDYALDQLGDVTITAPSSNQILSYNGSIWTNSDIPPPSYEEFVATAGQTVFNTTLTTTAKAAGKAYLQVFRNGVFQQEGATKVFTVTGANQITFAAGVSLSDDIAIYSYS